MNDGELATGYVRLLVKRDKRGTRSAFDSISRRVGETAWTIWQLYHGRRKTAGYGLIRKLRNAYCASLEGDIARLRAKLEIELQREGMEGCGDAEIAAVARELEVVSGKVEAFRNRLGGE